MFKCFNAYQIDDLINDYAKLKDAYRLQFALCIDNIGEQI